MVPAGPKLGDTSAPEAAPAGPHTPRRDAPLLGLVAYTWDLSSDRITWGPNAADVLRLPDLAAWSSGREFEQAVDASEGMSRSDAVWAAGQVDQGSGVRYAAFYQLRLGAGDIVAVDDTGRWMADAEGRPAVAHGTMRLRRAGPETGDGSRARAAFLTQLAADIAEAGDTKRPVTVFVMAVSNLSELNEDLGFEVSDQVIGTVVARLCGTMRLRDRFVRYSGNRFALALRGCGAAEAETAARRLTQAVEDEIVGTSRGPRTIRLVIGAASAPDHALEAPSLLRRAEASLGLAKRRAGSSFVMYDPRLFRSAPRGDRLAPLLESIELLNSRRVAIACQPVVSARTREIAFAEALLRVEGRDGRIQPAGDVVPALERAGLVHLADACMLELVTNHLARQPGLRLALNVSPASIERPDWAATIAAHLGAKPDVAPRLIIEVTETVAVRDPDATCRALEAVKELGVSVALDDFGAGHTSFRHLRRFPLDFIKIDGAFIQNLARSEDDRYFVRTLIDLARRLKVATVAEWVEDEESARLLTSWGVDYLQGDHLGPPELVVPERGSSPSSLVA